MMASIASVPAPGGERDLTLAGSGKRRIEWAFQSMPVLQSIRKRFIKAQAMADVAVAACLHVTTETANLMILLRDGGAKPCLVAASQQFLQNDVAASLLADYGIPLLSPAEALALNPTILLDSGGTLIQLYSQAPSGSVIAATESTNNGVTRLKALAKSAALPFPVIATNDAMTKHLFDHHYGTGQSTMDGILRATNILLAGLTVVIAGYGWCGRGVASRARGMGANIVVCEVDPVKALEALMDGYRVMSMGEAAALGDVFITVTGNKSVIQRDHFDKMKNGAILCNSGHYNIEIDLEALSRAASSKRQIREFVEEYSLRDGRKIHVLGEGHLINLSSAEGHPASVMDMSFANQALSVEYLIHHHSSLDKQVYAVPVELDRQVARLKLEALGIKIDRLSVEQEQYLSTWPQG